MEESFKELLRELQDINLTLKRIEKMLIYLVGKNE